MSPKLQLRTMSDADLDALLAIETDTRCVQQSGYPAITQAALAQLIASNQQSWQQYGAGGMSVYLGETLIGRIDVQFNTLNEFQIGWVIHPDYWGQGYAFTAAQQVLSLCNALRPMTVYTMASNQRSNALALKLGFVEDGRKIMQTGQESIRYVLKSSLSVIGQS